MPLLISLSPVLSILVSVIVRSAHAPPILTTIASAIRHQQQLLEQAHVVNTLEWNPGNHFQDDLCSVTRFT
jgi:hypothetical protein